MVKSSLLAQGAYGCVYYPGLSCGKTDISKYVSKLVRDDKTSRTEYNIGQLVKTIPHYDKLYIIPEKKCKITNTYVNEIKEGCKMIEKHSNNSKFIILYSKYLESDELSDVLINNEMDYYKLLKLSYTIYKRISSLLSAGIIHMDLHFSNILISKKNKVYAIDFGLCLDQSKFMIGETPNMAYLHENWFSYKPDWPSWTIEYILLSLMIKEKVTLTKENIKTAIDSYYKEHSTLSFFLNKSAIKYSYSYFESYANHSNNHNIKKLLLFSNTWDYYKLGHHVLSYMRRKSIDFPELKWLLLMMMNPNPELRPTTEELKVHFDNYLKLFHKYKLKYSNSIGHDESMQLKHELSRTLKSIK